MILSIIILLANLMYSNEYEVYTVKKGDSLSLILLNKGVSLNSLLGRDKSPGMIVENILINPEVENWYLLEPGRKINIKLVSSDTDTRSDFELKSGTIYTVNEKEKLEPVSDEAIKEEKIVLVNEEKEAFEGKKELKNQEISKDDNNAIESTEELNPIYKQKSYFSENKFFLGLGIIYNTETQINSKLIKMDPSFLIPVLGYSYKYRSSIFGAAFEPRFLTELSYVLKDDIDGSTSLPLNIKFEIGLARYATWTFNDTSFSPYLGFGYRTDNTVTATLAKEARTSKTFYLAFSPEFETAFNDFIFSYNLFYNLSIDTESEGENFSNYELGFKTEFCFNNAFSYFLKYYYSYFENELETINMVSHKAILGIAYKI